MSKSAKKPAASKAAKNATPTKPELRKAKSENVLSQSQAEKTGPATAGPSTDPVTTAKTLAKKRAIKKADGEAKPQKLSAIDAAAQVLAGSKKPMNCKALIEAMSAQGLWTSPGGKTPAATLYSSILREISTKGTEARFVKTDRGHFQAKG